MPLQSNFPKAHSIIFNDNTMSISKLQKLFAALAVICAAPGVAQEIDSTKTLFLNQVVISATRTNQEVFDVGRSVTVIDEQTISSSIYQSVGDLLQAKVGIDMVGSLQNPGTNQSLFLRGANSNHLTVLIDGIRITDPSTPNSALDLSELSLTNVERIEIVRGSHGTIYGGAAIGGVINIITKRAQNDGFNAFVDVVGGTFGDNTTTFNQGLGVNYSGKGFYATAELYNSQVNGFDATIDSISSPSTFRTTDGDDFRKTDAYISAGYSNDKIDGFLSYKRIDQETDIDDGAFNDDDNYVLNFNRDLVNYGFTYHFSNSLSLALQGGISFSQRDALDDSSLVDNQGNYDQTYFESRHKSDLLTQEVQLSKIADFGRILLGAGTYQEEMSFRTFFFSDGVFGPFQLETNYDSIKTDASTNYLFVQSQLDGSAISIQPLTITAGLRYSNHDRFGSNFTYEVNPSLRLGRSTRLYASLSTGFNAPSLVQLFDPSQGFGALTTRGNIDLNPETSSSLEFGAKKTFTKAAFTVALFQTRVKDAIEYVYLWDPSQPVQNLTFAEYRGDTYINTSEQTVKGVEIDVELQPVEPLRIGLGYSYIDGEVAVSMEDLDVEYTQNHHVQLFNSGQFISTDVSEEGLIRRPSHILNARADYKIGSNLQIGAQLRSVDERPDPSFDATLGPFGALSTTPISGYTLIDFVVNYKINEHIRIGMEIDNLLDEDFQVIRGFSTRGRSLNLKIRAKL